MANAFSYFLPDGTPVNAGAAPPPPGTAFRTSEALVPDANGALTSTATGDAANAFRGFVSADGGGFGGYNTVPLANDPSGRTFKQYDQDFVKNANALKQVPRLSETEYQAMGAQDSGANAVKDKIARGLPVSDKELAFVRWARGMELTQDTNSPTFGTYGTATPAQSAPGTPPENAVSTPNKVNPVPADPFAAFGADTLPPTEGAILSPRIITNTPPPVEEGYRKFTGRTFSPDAGGGAPPLFSQAAWSGGEAAPSAGSAARPSLSAGRFGRFSPIGGASPFAQKYRQRFKPLGAPANGFTPQGGGEPTTQVF